MSVDVRADDQSVRSPGIFGMRFEGAPYPLGLEKALSRQQAAASSALVSRSRAVPAGGRRSKPSPRFFSLGRTRFRGPAGRSAGLKGSTGRTAQRSRASAPITLGGGPVPVAASAVQMKNPGAGWPRGSGSARIADYLLFRITSRCTWRKRQCSQGSGGRLPRQHPRKRHPVCGGVEVGRRGHWPRSGPFHRRRPICN